MRLAILTALTALATVTALGAAASAQTREAGPERDYYDGLVYRNIGPWRGGRATAVAGWAGDQHLFYMGSVGGLFRTRNAGASWEALGDDTFATGPVGAVAVAPSDPNVVYVGMGESPFRGVASSQGDGVYRSTDGGESWTHLGLAATRQIAAIAIHPDQPDTAWVAAQGDVWEASADRGVYKTTDGGASWRLILAGENDTTGAVDLTLDPTNPRVLYAALWDNERTPWHVRSGGPGSGVWRSRDGGESWEELTDGLPAAMGKIGVSASGGRAGRVYAVVEAAEDKGGLYRSDDGGDSWRLLNGERRVQARSWYYMHIQADPVDADTVYVQSSDLLRSIDGGATFEALSAPHVDHHDLWINPDDPAIIADANDGGAVVSLDGGASWSSILNQPTGQFYRIAADNQIPYRIYAAQQDSSTLSIASFGVDGTIGRDDYHPVGGCESGHIAFDPDAPRYIYAGCFLGGVTEYDAETRTSRQISAYPELRFGVAARERRYRWNWNAPILVSRHDRDVVYHAGDRVWRTADRGVSWREISPDLTRDDPKTQGPGGIPITNEISENYNTITALAESWADAGMLWAGTDDGLVHVTRDGGESWTDVTPRGVDRGLINAIEVSPHDAERVYVVAARYKLGDDRPRIHRTENGGRSWRRLDDGLPDEAFARVVREDPQRAGLLFAGTERGVHVSFDSGATWRSLQANLPHIPVTDLKIHQGDLLVATQGRGIWILDDISPLRRPQPAQGADALFDPAPAVRMETVAGEPAARGPNPPAGALIHYALAAAPDLDETALKLEILDGETVIRTLLSDAEKGGDGGGEPTSYALPAQAGLNRAVWAFDTEPVTEVPDFYEFAGGPDGIIAGYAAAPGAYRVRLSLGERVIGEAPLEVAWDPRLRTTPEQIAEQQELTQAAYAMLDELHRSVNALQAVKAQVKERRALLETAEQDDPAADAGEALIAAIDAWDESVVSREPEFFQDVLNWPFRLSSDLQVLAGGLNGATGGVTEGARRRFADLSQQWREAMARRDDALALREAYEAALAEAGAARLVTPPLKAQD